MINTNCHRLNLILKIIINIFFIKCSIQNQILTKLLLTKKKKTVSSLLTMIWY